MNRNEHSNGRLDKILRTQRLELRRFRLSDAESFYHNFTGDFENLKFFTDVHYDLKHTSSLILQWLSASEHRTHCRWAITIKNCNDVIGIVSLRTIDPVNRIGEISFGIGKLFWGNGFVAEAVQSVLNYCAVELRLIKIIAAFDKRNIQAVKVAKKCEMKYAKEVIESREKDCVVFDLYERIFNSTSI